MEDLDWDRLVVGGGSAGAITAANFAYLADDVGLEAPPVAAVLDFWGGINLGTAADDIDAGDPAAFIVHGTDDTTVPIRWSQEITAALESLGTPVRFHPVEGAGHGVNIWEEPAVVGEGVIADDLWRFLDAALFPE